MEPPKAPRAHNRQVELIDGTARVPFLAKPFPGLSMLSPNLPSLNIQILIALRSHF